MKDNLMDSLQKALKMFGQAVLYGPPGTGKTYTALKLWESISRNESKETDPRFSLVVFHPGFEYEQFMRGLRMRTKEGSDAPKLYVVDGHFVRMCWRAHYLSYLDLTGKVQACPTCRGQLGKNPGDPSKDLATVVAHGECLAESKSKSCCLLVIDELNRGNVPALMGELLYALEKDKRGTPVKLPYEIPDLKDFKTALELDALRKAGFPGAKDESAKTFYEIVMGSANQIQVPHNLWVIGTMNTSDRSIGSIDAAVRRRFAFIYTPPDPALVATSWEELGSDGKSIGEHLGKALTKINNWFRDDLKQEIRVGGLGHSYFLPLKNHMDVEGKPENSSKLITTSKENLELQVRYFVVPLMREYLEMQLIRGGHGETAKEFIRKVLEASDATGVLAALDGIQEKP